MTGLPEPLQAAIRGIADSPRLLVCSDFDGTLSPIVPVPDDARPVAGAVAVLEALAALPDTETVLISGRAVVDLARLAGTGPAVVLVGSHGAEFSDGFAREIDQEQRALHERILAATTAIADGVGGVRQEIKPISIAIHVRQSARDDAAKVLAAVRSGPATWPGVYVTEGKEVIELAVQPVDKGTAIVTLKQRIDATATIFFGDDVTDERGFAVLTAGDVGVKIGDGESAADYRLTGPTDVLAALELLLALRVTSSG